MSVALVADLVRRDGTSLLDSTDEVDAVVEACSTTLRPHRLQMKHRDGRLSARLHSLTSGAVALSRLNYGADVTISEIRPQQDEFILALPVAGHARFRYGSSTAVVSPGSMAVVGPYDGFTLEITREFDQVLVRLDRTRVESAAAFLAGSGELGPVHFDLAAGKVSPALTGLVQAALQVSADPAVERRPRLTFQLERLIIEATLLGCRNNLSAAMAGPSERISSDRVARARDFMVANLADQFSLTAVARHCGVSLRSLQHGFRRELDMSPGEWLRNQRLDLAHAQLVIAVESETTVTAVASACGFVHLGDFAARFKDRFGSSPSAVLRAPRS